MWAAVTLAPSYGCKEFLRKFGGKKAETVCLVSTVPPLSLWRSGYLIDGVFGDAPMCVNSTLIPFYHQPFSFGMPFEDFTLYK